MEGEQRDVMTASAPAEPVVAAPSTPPGSLSLVRCKGPVGGARHFDCIGSLSAERRVGTALLPPCWRS